MEDRERLEARRWGIRVSRGVVEAEVEVGAGAREEVEDMLGSVGGISRRWDLCDYACLCVWVGMVKLAGEVGQWRFGLWLCLRDAISLSDFVIPDKYAY